MGRSRREGPGRRIRGGGGQLPRIGRAPAFLPQCGSNATFRMQRLARTVCSGSRGPGAGNQLASVSEIRACGGGGGHWANTRRPPQSPVLDSARGSAGPAVTRLRAAGWRSGGSGGGEPGPLPSRGGLCARPRRGLAAGAHQQAGAAPGRQAPREGAKHFFLPSNVQNFAPFPNKRGGPTPVKTGLV